MVGTWDIKVTLCDCQTGHPIELFRAMNTFGCGGTVIETVGRDKSSLCSLGQGMWRHIGGQSYCAVLRFFRFDGAGAVAGTQKVSRHIELSPNGNEFTATATVEVFDTEDRLIETNCATEKAKRLE